MKLDQRQARMNHFQKIWIPSVKANNNNNNKKHQNNKIIMPQNQ